MAAAAWKNRLKKSLLGGQAADSPQADAEPRRAPDGAESEIVVALRDHVVELSEGKLTADAIDPERHLFDHGYVDSLSAVMLLAHIDETWGIEIEDTKLIESLTSLRALADHIEENR